MTVSQPIPAPVGATQPRTKPPLTARERSGSLLAGGVGFSLLSLGFALFMIPASLLVFGALFAVILGAVQRGSDDRNLGGFVEFIERVNPGAWVLPLVIVAIVGLVIAVGALFVSAGILRSRGVQRPWAVTWAGAAIAVVASWIASGLLSVPVQLMGVFRDDDASFDTPSTLVAGGLSFLVGIVLTAAVGALSWWWMAHTMRPAVRTP